MSGDILSNYLALLLLNQLPSISREDLSKAIEIFGDPASIVEGKNRGQLAKVGDFGSRWVNSLKKVRRQFDAKRELDRCSKEGIQLVGFFDEAYPSSLKEIYDPPLVLYVKGDTASFHAASLAIVGSRRPSIYGEEIAKRFASRLSRCGLTIVSGLARGIDRAAHLGALNTKSRTVAILGSGIDVVYPKDNQELFDAISERGALVSEFPLGMLPLPYNFPRRNRIISGLSLGVLVVEANERSGSLITARCAAEQGREVYAIPGKIDSPTSKGTNRLLREGAKLVIEPDDILIDLELQLKDFTRTLREEGEPQDAALPHAADLTDRERSILSLLKEDSLSADDIVKHLGSGTGEVLSALTTLEIKGFIRKREGVFTKTRG